MKKFILTCLLAGTSAVMYGQKDEQGYEDGKWVLKGVAGLNLSQTAMSNWSSGGENSVAGNAYLNGSLVHKRGHWLWVTNLAMDYGLAKNKSEGVRKNTDKIELATQLGYTTDNIWFYTLAGNLNTQFAKGYNYPDKEHYISNFFAPAYSNIALGVEYRPKSNYSVMLSPASMKMTFVQDDYLSSIGAFGVDPGKRFRIEPGAYLKARAELGIMENVNLITSADFFTPYNSDFGNVDVNWDVLISLKVNKYLSATINTTLKYDDDVPTFSEDGTRRGPKVQFKEVLGVGVAYNF
ncbi:Protein of unknown function [Phocaeicola vulgatus]|jgi:hypothetical protein|uniref:DUF3078 domain-containing protein n=1 Tax=Bacteroides xylanisolvens XB1A TaxID=657309 RepID=D6CZA9_9BACE|nr:DUF3078 domain-containing protein [Phocaeicola vulgatus]CBK67511.1 Protein of unknown function (DUF3078) [Bacteroides xylanisolvens XB1A]SEL52024.1 Protein of unknown function [Phocaeicola vulgatus]